MKKCVLNRCALIAGATWLLLSNPLPASPYDPRISPETKAKLARIHREKQNFTVTMTLSQKTIYPYEPVGVVVTLKNKLNRSFTALGPWNSHVSISRSASGPWERYHPAGPQYSSPGWRTKAIAPRQSLSRFHTIDVNHANRHSLAVPGVYNVRAWYNANVSAPQRLVVKAPPAGERAAIQTLSRNRLYRYFTYGSAWIHLGMRGQPDPSADLRSFIRRFPNSRYADWARLALIYIQRRPVDKKLGDLHPVQKQLERLAPQAVGPVKALCFYEAGAIARQRKDLGAARVYFRKSLDTKADATIAGRIAILNQLYPHPKPATDPYSVTVRQLKAQGYDVDTFLKSWSEPARIYRFREGQLFELRLQKKISQQELNRRQVALIRYYVTRYVKPKR